MHAKKLSVIMTYGWFYWFTVTHAESWQVFGKSLLQTTCPSRSFCTPDMSPGFFSDIILNLKQGQNSFPTPWSTVLN